MGNRAVITTEVNFLNYGIGIYLHWNGGRDSINAFLTYCKLKGYRSPDVDCYGFARLCQVIGNFIGGSLSIGINTLDCLDCDNRDNGVYIIKDWEIVGREYFEGEEQDTHDLMEMLKEIDESQPKKERLGEILNSIEIPTTELKKGDVVYTKNFLDQYEKHVIVGFGRYMGPNGEYILNVPFTEECGGRFSQILTDTVRIKKRK